MNRIFFTKRSFVLWISLPTLVWITMCAPPEQSHKVALVRLRTDNIVLDTLTPWHGNHYHFFTDPISGKQYLALSNQKANSLHLYDWQAKGLPIKVVRFATEGPDGVGKLRGVTVVNFDSILVVSPFNYSLTLVDTSGKVKRRYQLLANGVRYDGRGKPENGYSALPVIGAKKSIVKIGHLVYLPVSPNLDPYANQPAFLEDSELMLVLDLLSSEVKYHTHFPSDYKNRSFFPLAYLVKSSFSYNPRSGRFVWSFPASALVHEIGMNGEALAQHEARPLGVEEIPLLPGNAGNDTQLESKHTTANHSYDKVIYDPYRHLYFRFFNRKKPNYNPSDPAQGLSYTTQVMVLDVEFNNLGILDLPDHHDYHYCFPTPEGLVMEVLVKGGSEEYRHWATYRVDINQPTR
jgi:Domain of unknown function (DUF4221)